MDAQLCAASQRIADALAPLWPALGARRIPTTGVASGRKRLTYSRLGDDLRGSRLRGHELLNTATTLHGIPTDEEDKSRLTIYVAKIGWDFPL